MVCSAGACLPLGLLAVVLLQDQPQLIWEGEVDGVSILRVRGRQLDVEQVRGLPVQRQRVRFFERLPERRQNVRLEVVEGRGRVRILEHPRPENNFTLSVEIDDYQGGASWYSLAFYWAGGQRDWFAVAPPGQQGAERLWWSGRVDGEAIINCHRETCEAENIQGQPVTRERFRFTRALPAQRVLVSLEDKQGRGEVRLLEQPHEENGYRARVLIRDPQSGPGDYSFVLSWSRPLREELPMARRGMLWSGRVDGQVRVIVQGSEAVHQVVSGAPVEDDRAQFFRPLPARNLPEATVRKLRGRGKVEIIEYPSARNGYRLVFEINDPRAGSDYYEVEVGW